MPGDEQVVPPLALPMDVWLRRITDEVPLHDGVIVERDGLSPVVWRRTTIAYDPDSWCLPGRIRPDIVRTLEEQADDDTERVDLGMRRAVWVASHGESAGWGDGGGDQLEAELRRLASEVDPPPGSAAVADAYRRGYEEGYAAGRVTVRPADAWVATMSTAFDKLLASGHGPRESLELACDLASALHASYEAGF
jgi:hypothetical protein